MHQCSEKFVSICVISCWKLCQFVSVWRGFHSSNISCFSEGVKHSPNACNIVMFFRGGKAHVRPCDYISCLLDAIGHLVDSFSPSHFH
jgi:hypothetical protein